MAELSDPAAGPPAEDWITCPGGCGQRYDRNKIVQCTSDGCMVDLFWEPVAAPQRSAATPATSLEPQPLAPAPIAVIIEGQGFSIADGGTLQLGRAESLPTARVLGPFLNLSREHAQLRYDGGRLYVLDRRPSMNGTFVDDIRLQADQEYEIRAQQRLRLGSNPSVHIEIVWP